MKKFISMVMAAAMVVSLVPATAFAANTAVFKVQGAHEWTEDEAEKKSSIAGPQIQIIMQDVDTEIGKQDEYEITFDFDNAEFLKDGYKGTDDWAQCVVVRSAENGTGEEVPATVKVDEVEFEDTSFTITVKEGTVTDDQGNVKVAEFTKGDMIVVPVDSSWGLTNDSEGTVATVTVSGDFGESEAMPVASVLAQGLDITVAGKVVEVAEEEICKLKKVTIESVVGNFASTDEIKVKVSKGFEITKYPAGAFDKEDDSFKVSGYTGDEIVFAAGDIEIEAVSAKAGDIATLTVSCKGYDGDSDEAAEVIADAVIMSVDEDEDVPVMYSGVNTAEYGLTSEEDHTSLKVTIEESVVDAWDTVDKWALSLPEGVYVTDVKFDTTGTTKDWKEGTATATFEEAYRDGNYKEFDFGRRSFDAINDKTKIELKFTLDLVAEPTFVGDVVLTLEGEGVGETQEVVIANFVAPYTVEAAQNDLVIDYKETVVPTPVVITEAEAGLWKEDTAWFALAVEKIEVEDADITVNEDSEMEIDVDGEYFMVEEESDEEAAVVTMDNVALYMQRNIPAGAYDLKLYTAMYNEFLDQTVFGQDAKEGIYEIGDVLDASMDKNNNWDDCVTVKEAFVNVITAGRDQDDASFTKKVVVPVGAMEIVAGEDVVALDVPAYINAAGYTMLPVRAVAVALGINTNNVIWDQATKTVTILYGQRIITMTVGQKVINVNGSAIPASAAVEVVNGRTFLGLRDLATALGVVDITWDAATQTATLNGGNK